MGEIIRESELRNNNAEIMRRVADGESFTITVHGRPEGDRIFGADLPTDPWRNER